MGSPQQYTLAVTSNKGSIVSRAWCAYCVRCQRSRNVLIKLADASMPYTSNPSSVRTCEIGTPCPHPRSGMAEAAGRVLLHSRTVAGPIRRFRARIEVSATCVRIGLKRNQLCAVKGAGLQRVKVPPGNWFAPPGSNGSGGGGNEAAEASDGKGRSWRLRESVGRNVSER
jgi:hypothetical protein